MVNGSLGMSSFRTGSNGSAYALTLIERIPPTQPSTLQAKAIAGKTGHGNRSIEVSTRSDAQRIKNRIFPFLFADQKVRHIGFLLIVNER